MRSIPINRYPYGHAGCSFETVGTLKTTVEERQSRGALSECECQLFNMKHAIPPLAEESEPLAPFLSGSHQAQLLSAEGRSASQPLTSCCQRQDDQDNQTKSWLE